MKQALRNDYVVPWRRTLFSERELLRELSR